MYSNDDTDWGNGLLHLLEERHHLKCCIHYRDFELGIPFFDNMANSVEICYKIIAVFSENFLKSRYCSFELERAKYRLLNKNDNSLVIIRIDGTDCRRLPPELRQRSLIDYHNAIERPLWRRRLLNFLEIPDDSSDQNATVTMDNNNSNDCHTGTLIANGHDRVRNQFNRLNSTSSSDTVESFV